MLVRKTVTILFSDVVTSTELGERLDPETLRRIMSRWFEEMQVIVERHGGTVEKFIGDEVMAVFGVPVVHEDDALRAVRAAAEMRDRLAELNVELDATWDVRLEARTGINTGQVVAGDPASGGTFVTGEAVVLAKRLETAAGPGEILIGKATYPLVRDAVNAGPLESFSVKGKEHPVSPWRLDDIEAGAPGLIRRLDAPLVGRQSEVAQLRDAFERVARDATCELVTVLGPAGIGKSRLAAELVAGVEERATALTGRCLPYGEGITFWPLAQIAREAGGDEALEVALDGAEDADLIAAHVRAAIGASPPSGGSAETFWAVRRFLEALARPRPLVLVLEDIHWAEPTFLDLLEYVAGFSRGAPLLLLCLARGELLDRQPSWTSPRANATVLPLEPLSEPDAEALLSGLPGHEELTDAVRRRIAAAAEGNAFFIEQMVALALEEDQGERALAVPPSIQALLAERLDRLNAGERVVLERAAVIGKDFPARALAELCPSELQPAVGQHLLSLLRKDLIRPDASTQARGDGFRFRHALIRDAAYDGLPKEIRAELHERVAAWNEAAAGTRATELQEITGYHLEQAYRYREQLGAVDEAARELASKGATLLAAAGLRAYARGDMPAAAGLLTRSTILLRDDDDASLELAPHLGTALLQNGDLAQAEGVLSRAVAGARQRENRRVEAHALFVSAQLRYVLDADTTAEDIERDAERSIERFEELRDPLGLAKAWHQWGYAYVLRGRWGEAEARRRRALEYATEAADQRTRASILNALGASLYYGATPVKEAMRACEEIRGEAPKDLTVQTAMTDLLAGLAAMDGAIDDARRLAARSMAICQDLGVPLWLAHAKTFASVVEVMAGDPAAATRELRDAVAVLEEVDPLGLVDAAIHLAQALYARGEYEKADRWTRVSEEATRRDDVYSQVGRRVVRAKLLALDGELDPARALAEEAVELAAATDSPNLQGDAFLDLARVLQVAGQVPDARRAAEHACDRYAQKGNVVRAREARQLADSLATARPRTPGRRLTA
jgi:class 3 adenylate cyclase/tetratricopeptide (TPR) repeat protein